jgi:5-methylcytosine-specific restriction endonuclease McrA
VVLEVDHVVPRAEGGSDDTMNLVTSCFDCNRGKGAVPLTDIVTGGDPHDEAILLP